MRQPRGRIEWINAIGFGSAVATVTSVVVRSAFKPAGKILIVAMVLLVCLVGWRIARCQIQRWAKWASMLLQREVSVSTPQLIEPPGTDLVRSTSAVPVVHAAVLTLIPSPLRRLITGSGFALIGLTAFAFAVIADWPVRPSDELVKKNVSQDGSNASAAPPTLSSATTAQSVLDAASTTDRERPSIAAPTKISPSTTVSTDPTATQVNSTDAPTEVGEPLPLDASSYTPIRVCGWDDTNYGTLYRGKSVVTAYCHLQPRTTAEGPAKIDINIPDFAKALRGRLVLADKSVPSGVSVMVSLSVDGVPLPDKVLTFADEYVFDVPTIGGERRVAFVLKQPDDASSADAAFVLFLDTVFVR